MWLSGSSLPVTVTATVTVTVQVVADPRPVNIDPLCDPSLNDFGVDGAQYVRYVSWGEAQTMIYLKISLSDFFTVFAARCRSWYVQAFPFVAVVMVLCHGCSIMPLTMSLLPVCWRGGVRCVCLAFAFMSNSMDCLNAY